MAYGLRYPILTAQWTDIPSLFTSLSEILSNQRQFQVLITDCDSNERNLQNYFHIDFTKPTVLIIGSEATGVSPEVSLSLSSTKLTS
jgi:tRNA G18 (ribose-2'-O)-methylase SpoU